MKNKSLSSTNRYLARNKSGTFITNVASSTAVETGKPTSVYAGRALSRSSNMTQSLSSVQPKK